MPKLILSPEKAVKQYYRFNRFLRFISYLSLPVFFWYFFFSPTLDNNIRSTVVTVCISLAFVNLVLLIFQVRLRRKLQTPDVLRSIDLWAKETYDLDLTLRQTKSLADILNYKDGRRASYPIVVPNPNQPERSELVYLVSEADKKYLNYWKANTPFPTTEVKSTTDDLHQFWNEIKTHGQRIWVLLEEKPSGETVVYANYSESDEYMPVFSNPIFAEEYTKIRRSDSLKLEPYWVGLDEFRVSVLPELKSENLSVKINYPTKKGRKYTPQDLQGILPE